MFVSKDDRNEALDDLLAWTDPLDFKRRRREIGTVIVGQSTPSIFGHYYLIQIRGCYQFGLFDATVVFCRALLEVVLKEALMKSGKYKVVYLNERNLDGHIRNCKNYNILTEESLKKADDVRKKANSILHTRGKINLLSQGETLSVVKDTFSVLEEIYQ